MTLAYLLLIGVVAVAAQRLIALRVWGRPVFVQGFTGDASVHFAIIRHFSGSRRSRFIDNYLISPSPMSYPVAFHRFAALFPLSMISRKPWLPNFVLHLAGAVFLMVVAWLISDGSLLATGLALAIWVTMPGAWVFSGAAIAYLGLSERYLSRLACSGGYLGLAAGTVLDESWLLAVGLVMSVLGLLSGQFARQALLFCVPVLSLVLLDARPVLLLLAAVALALLVGRRHQWDGLRHTALRWRLYRTRTKQSAHVRRAMLGYFRWDFRRGISPKRIVLNLMEKDPTRNAFWYPELLLSCAIPALVPFQEHGPFLLALIPPVLLYLLTLTERFNHLGEAYRYLEYNLTFLIPVLIGLSFVENSWWIAGLAVYGVFVLAIILLQYRIQLARRHGRNFPHDEISSFLEITNIEEPAVVFPVSMRLGADLVVRREDWKTFWWQPGSISDGIYDDYIEEYPFLKRDWRPLAERHGATHIFVDKRQDERMKDWRYDFSRERKIAEDEKFVAYEVRSVTHASELGGSDVANDKCTG